MRAIATDFKPGDTIIKRYPSSSTDVEIRFIVLNPMWTQWGKLRMRNLITDEEISAWWRLERDLPAGYSLTSL